MDQKTIVAKGYIVSMDESKQVCGYRLGSNWAEINVQSAEIEDEPLMRPYSFMNTIGDAVGISIAWPCSLVYLLAFTSF